MPAQPLHVLLVALALSGAGLLGGPLILSLGRGRAAAAAALEGLTLGLVPTMVVLRLLPHVTESLGALAVGLTVLAFVGLRWFDRAHHRAAARVGRAFIYTALLFHSFTDGVGLAAAIAAGSAERAIDPPLVLAFVVHRLPEGLFIATTLLPSYGTRRTLLRILGLITATVLGGALGGALLPHLPERLFDGVVALGLGAMLQIVVHSHAERAGSPAARGLAAVAMLLGVAIALAVPSPRDLLRMATPHELSMVESLGPLFVHTAPAFAIALVVAAAIAVVLPPRTPTAGGARSRLLDGLHGLVLGALLPVGPAGVLPTARGLERQGAAPSTVAAFAVAASALALDGVVLCARLLGPRVPLLVLPVLVVLSLAAALVTGGAPVRPASLPPAGPARPPSRRRAREAGAVVLRALDQRGAFYLIGMLVAAALEAALAPRALAVTPALGIALGLLCALPLQLPLVALAPVAAVLAHKGLPDAAVLAIVVAGPTTSTHALGVLARLTSAGAALRVVGCVGIAASAVALLAPLTGTAVVDVHALARRGAAPLSLALSVIVAAFLLASLLRLGPRLWLGQLILFGEPGHDHASDHDAAHAD